jgi:hypothetical protein
MTYVEPSKVAHYQYLAAGYQLLADLIFFDKSFAPIQWVGFAFLFLMYSGKFTSMCLRLRNS